MKPLHLRDTNCADLSINGFECFAFCLLNQESLEYRDLGTNEGACVRRKLGNTCEWWMLGDRLEMVGEWL